MDNSLYLAKSCLHQNGALYSVVRVFAARKCNIKKIKYDCTTTLKLHAICTAHVKSALGVKGLLAAEWSKLQTKMNMSAFTKNDIRPEFRTFRTYSK